MSQPIPVIPLEYAKPATAGRRPTFVKVVHVVALAVCAVAWVLIVAADVETVMATGPILCALGLTLGVSGLVYRDRRSAWFGFSHVAICVVFFLLVNVLNWSPGRATAPFAIMGGVYTLSAITVAILPRFRRQLADSGPSGTMNTP